MKRIVLGAVALAAAAVTFGVAPAHADATANISVGTQYGNVLRAEFKQNVDGSGYFYRTYGSGNCTVSTSTPDIQISSMPNWDNAASWIKDFAQCDVKIFRFVNFDTALTGYVHYGSSGQSLEGAGLNNLTSSYYVS